MFDGGSTMENEMRDALKRMGQKREIKGRKYIVDATGEVVIQPFALGAPYNLMSTEAAENALRQFREGFPGLYQWLEENGKEK
jgi:hypothetical protein